MPVFGSVPRNYSTLFHRAPTCFRAQYEDPAAMLHTDCLSFQNVLSLHWVWIMRHIYLNRSAYWVAGDSFTVRLCFGLHGQFSIEDLVHRHVLVETAGRFHLAVAALFPPLPLFLHRWNRRHACVSSQYCPDILISATIWTRATDLKQMPSILH